MKPLFSYGTTSQLLAAGLLALPVALAAQTASPTQEADWRRANDAVGAFKRGHADVLKWEQANTSAATATPASTLGVAMPTTEAAVRMAWTVHRDLARVGQQVIVSTHVLEHLQDFDRVIWLEQGRVRADGHPVTVCADYRADVAARIAARTATVT